MIDVKRFELDYFSTNPTIMDKENRLRVITPRWRACVGLTRGYRYLEVDPSYSEVVLHRRSAWFSKSVVRLPFDEIRNIKPAKYIDYDYKTQQLGRIPVTVTQYSALWSVYLVLENQGDMLPLFEWKKYLFVMGQPVSPLIDHQAADESGQERDFNRLVSRLCELTGKPLSWG